MRRISIPRSVMEKALALRGGDYVAFSVKVDWPEFKLTEEQVFANAQALVSGQPTPYPDPSIIQIEMPRVTP